MSFRFCRFWASNTVRRSVVLLALAAGFMMTANRAGAEDKAEQSVTLHFIPTEVREVSTVRIDTGKFQKKPNGESEAVYRVERPKEGDVFVQVGLQVADIGDPLTLTKGDFSLENPMQPKATYEVVDWYREEGSVPQRADSLVVAAKAILDVVFEVPKDDWRGLDLFVSGIRLGPLAQLEAKAVRPPEESY